MLYLSLLSGWYRTSEGCLLSIMLVTNQNIDARLIYERQSKLWWKQLFAKHTVSSPRLFASRVNHCLTICADGNCVSDATLVIVKPIHGRRGAGVQLSSWRDARQSTANDVLIEEYIPLNRAAHTRLVTIVDENGCSVLNSLLVTAAEGDTIISNLGSVVKRTPPEPITTQLLQLHQVTVELAACAVCWDIIESNDGVQHVLEGNWPGGAISWKISDTDVMDKYALHCIHLLDAKRASNRLLPRRICYS